MTSRYYRRYKRYDYDENFNSDLAAIANEAGGNITSSYPTQTLLPHSPTPQAQLLHNALVARGIKCTLEKWDGNKHIDIAIPWTRINIEIDGSHHYTDAKQMASDFQRDYYSARKGFKTIRFPNYFIEKHLDKIADGIAHVARGEYYKRRYNGS